ncbi:ABC transporter ATP-binding protein [Mycetocola reblochoni]|uniref:Duplicated ATPase component YkoD of energizing module of thiamin-regulated ECF transporter for HydroxyMethylPyrimidine n=2 Tax=Mycetocola reblochoni TaxID=331618 RepID=A0A1R4JCU3_9MICO|nr:ABC transporter ATP-binding protein [Mycetocola reblochoni]RLP69964.1 ABC transporter ATP-binding protein [Mycetocola reblochoni]SJN29764.1 Duplicated ATPase component YkoD of energizing module of thiamin-regulated ECF transporter for HydroxyMethylPyrimidine [Mycetocola reblochoni REB411]
MASGARVTVEGWGWRHAGRRLPAVSDLDLTIEPGQRVLLVGASGAGKSTTLAGIAGLLGGSDEGDQTGRILVDGRPPELQRGRIGMVLQDPDAQLVMSTVGDDAAFGCENLGLPREEIWARVRRGLAQVGLELGLDHPTTRLSGGQKQRLALAGVLAMGPGLIILDEPTANLDPDGIAEVRAAVEHVLEVTGATLIVVEHRTTVWSGLVDRVVALGVGGEGVVADGPPARVFAEDGAALEAAGLWIPGSVSPCPRADAVDLGGPALRLDDLAVARERRGPVVRSGITRSVRFGEAVGITGANGTGKSTLALTLAGLLPEAAGAVLASDELRAGAGPRPSRWRSTQLLTRIGTVFQDPEHQFVTSRVRDELAVGLRALAIDRVRVDERVDELLARLRLDALADANPFTLSGGQKRRLSVATLLATSPRIIVLDEPTFGQDRRSWGDLVTLLQQMRAEGGTIVSVTHDAEYLQALGDTVWHLGSVSERSAA